MSSDDSVRLKIGGRPNTIDPRALQRAVTGLIELLSAAGIESWVITDLHEGSVDLTVAPVGADDQLFAKFDAIVRGIDVLGTNDRLPEDWNLSMVSGLLAAADAEDEAGAEGISLSFGRVGSRKLTAEVRRHAKAASLKTHVSIGSVRGRIHRWVSQNGRREVSLVDEASQRTVRVMFRKDMEERVQGAIGRDIRAWGELRRDLDGRKSSLALDDFEVVGPLAGSRTVDEIVGLLGEDWTGNEDSASWVRRQRDE